MKIITDLIIKQKNSSSVFVFPSEAAAAARRREFLRNSGCGAVRNERFISWDRFKENITMHDRTDKPVNSIMRRIFASDIVRRNSEERIFIRLIPEAYRSQAGGFTDTVYIALPELESLVRSLEGRDNVIDPELSSDYHKLYHLYIDFMKANSFFEPSWELPELKAIGRECYIICPEIIEDFSEYEDILSSAGCVFIPAEEPKLPAFRLFENSAVETDSVLNEITSLLAEGSEASDITVTVADDSTAELFLAGARLRGLPINYRKGKPLAAYPAGRLPELLRACRNSDYSITSMKNLLLYRAFIWQEANTAAALIRFGIENRCLKNTSSGPSGDVWAKRLRTIASNSEKIPESCRRDAMLAFYRKLRAGIERVTVAGDFKTLSREFQVFVAAFLDTESGNWDAECEMVFQRTREVLSSLREVEDSIESIQITDPLGLWIEVLNEKIYVRQQPEAGIAVFPYRVSALINPLHHFIIGCSHDASIVASSSFSFLTDQQRRDTGAVELNMTDDFAGIYAASGADVRFSCSTETQSGTALPPAYFIAGGGIERVVSAGQDDDFYRAPVQAENLWWERACSAGTLLSNAGPLPGLSNLQIDGFSYAAASFMEPKGFDATKDIFPREVAAESIVPALSDGDGGFFRASATRLNNWSSCRFSMFLADVLGIHEDEYILRAEDPWTAGSVMHDVLYDFFDTLRSAGESFRYHGNSSRYEAMISESVERVFLEWEKSGNYFYGPAWDSLKRRVLEDLLSFPAAEAEYFEGLHPELLEHWLEFNLEEQAIRVFGKVDRISTGERGAVIVDYKKKWDRQRRPKFISEDESGSLLPPEKGYQLPLYILLARENGMIVDSATYYSITGRAHHPVSGNGGELSEEDVERLCSFTLDETGRMAEACRAGDFTVEPRCDGCGFRAVCRKRFNIGWVSE